MLITVGQPIVNRTNFLISREDGIEAAAGDLNHLVKRNGRRRLVSRATRLPPEIGSDTIKDELMATAERDKCYAVTFEYLSTAGN